jgi:hypothetical protein
MGSAFKNSKWLSFLLELQSLGMLNPKLTSCPNSKMFCQDPVPCRDFFAPYQRPSVPFLLREWESSAFVLVKLSWLPELSAARPIREQNHVVSHMKRHGGCFDAR